MTMNNEKLEVPEDLRRGGVTKDVERAVSDTLKLERIVCRSLSLPDLAGKAVLDIGCGWRMCKALLDNDLPIGSYTGIDVYKEAIEYLEANVNDERFTFHVLNANNEMYNPDGKALQEIPQLPAEQSAYDIIWAFSVFTHLAPHDYETMLKLLRACVKPDGKLVFSVFINEATAGGLGFIDNVRKQWEKNGVQIDSVNDRAAEYFAEQKVPDFIDFDPKQPLKWAIYSREHAIELVERTGWKIEGVHDPEDAIQHYIVCSPA